LQPHARDIAREEFAGMRVEEDNVVHCMA
jgi:hypothetical protein